MRRCLNTTVGFWLVALLLLPLLPMSVLGQSPRRGEPLAVSPDGKLLLFRRVHTGILVAAPDTGADLVVNASLVEDPDENTPLFLLGAASDGTVLVRRGATSVSRGAPNGSQFILTTVGDPGAVPVRALAAGDSVLVQTDGGDIVWLRPGKATVSVRPVDGPRVPVDMALSADGQRCAVSFEGQANSMGASTIIVRSVEGAFSRRLDTPLPVSNLALSSDGKILIGFTHDNPAGFPGSDKSHWDRWLTDDLSVTRLEPNPSLAPPLENPPPPPGLMPPVLPPGFTPPGLPPPGGPSLIVHYLLDQGASLAGSFSPNGTQIVLSNLLGGLGVFDAATGKHQFTIPVKYWQTSYQHGHRWIGSRLFVASAANTADESNILNASLYRIDLVNRRADPVAVSAPMRPFLGTSIVSWLSRLSPRPGNDVDIRVVAPARQNMVNVSSLPQLSNRSQTTGPPLPLDAAEEVGLSTRYLLFEDGTHYVEDDGRTIRVIEAVTGRVIQSTAPSSVLMAVSFATVNRWATLNWVDSWGAPDHSLQVQLYDGITSSGQITVTEPTAGDSVKLYAGADTLLAGPGDNQSGNVPHSNWTVYNVANGSQGQTFQFPITAKDTVELVGSPFGKPGVLVSGLVNPAVNQDTLYWQVLGGGRQVLADNLNWKPMAVASRDGKRLGVFLSHRESGEGNNVVVKRLGPRFFDFEPDSTIREKVSSRLRSYDAAQFIQEFGRTTRLWATSPDLKRVAIPIGNKIHVIDIDRDRLLATASLGLPFAVGDDYALLTRKDGTFVVTSLQTTP